MGRQKKLKSKALKKRRCPERGPQAFPGEERGGHALQNSRADHIIVI